MGVGVGDGSGATSLVTGSVTLIRIRIPVTDHRSLCALGPAQGQPYGLIMHRISLCGAGQAKDRLSVAIGQPRGQPGGSHGVEPGLPGGVVVHPGMLARAADTRSAS